MNRREEAVPIALLFNAAALVGVEAERNRMMWLAIVTGLVVLALAVWHDR